MKPEVLKIFGFEGEVARDIVFTNWLIMARAGLLALEHYNPQQNRWGQAHLQARFGILQVMLEAGQGFVEIQRIGEDDLRIVMNRDLIETVGRDAISAFLQKIQVYKATADLENARRMYDRYTSPNETFLAYRSIVLAKKKPRKLFVQCSTKLTNEGNSVELVEHEASPKGIIESFVQRFGVSDDTLPEFD